MGIQTVELRKRRCAKAHASGKVQLWVSLPLLDMGGLTRCFYGSDYGSVLIQIGEAGPPAVEVLPKPQWRQCMTITLGPHVPTHAGSESQRKD